MQCLQPDFPFTTDQECVRDNWRPNTLLLVPLILRSDTLIRIFWQIACNAILAIISARVLRSLGSQRTAFCGISFLAGGEVLAGFSVHDVGGLFVTAGVIMYVRQFY